MNKGLIRSELAGRLPSLDGWRAVSIALVLISHCTHVSGFPPSARELIRWLPDGGFGVQVFFVISGFLITHLMLAEHKSSGRMSLVGFYSRRALRIVPAYAAFLLFALALTIATPFALSFEQWTHLLTWTWNYSPHFSWPVSHIWSLSVEEQFYLVWPLALVAILGLGGRVRSLAAACLLPIVFCPFARILSYLHLGGLAFNAWSFLVQADFIAWGCLLAVLYRYFGDSLSSAARRHFGIILLAGLTSILVPLILTRLFILGPFTVPFGGTFNAIGVSSLIFLSIEAPRAGIFPLLNSAVFRLFGQWSYSIYLWQQFFCAQPRDYGLTSSPWFLNFPYWLAPSILAGIGSFYFIERPFLRLKSRLSQKHGNRIALERAS